MFHSPHIQPEPSQPHLSSIVPLGHVYRVPPLPAHENDEQGRLGSHVSVTEEQGLRKWYVDQKV